MKKITIAVLLISLFMFGSKTLNALEVSYFTIGNEEHVYDDYIELSTGKKVPVDYEDSYNIGFEFTKYYVDGLTEQELGEINNLQNDEIEKFQQER